MRVRTLGSALFDLADGRRFYDRQGVGVGDDFFSTLFAEIDALAVTGGVHRVVHGHHRALSRRFPYAIYYEVKAGEVVVCRVLDCRRDPGRISAMLGGR